MSADRAWLALVGERPPDASCAAPARDATSSEERGWLAVWISRSKPARQALRADPAAFDADGPPGFASLVLVPDTRRVTFDDSVVQRARQLVLAAGRPWTVATTLVSDDVLFRGALLAAPRPFAEDPFALVAPARRLELGAGLLSPGPLRLPAPHIERWAGKPWPQSGF